MIFFWLRALYLSFMWLFKKPREIDVARIRNDGKCPVCGNHGNKLECVHCQAVNRNTNGHSNPEPMCMHTCNTCKACWFEAPVRKITAQEVYPVKERKSAVRMIA